MADEKVSASLFAKWDGKLSNWALCYGGPRDFINAPERSLPVSDEMLDDWRKYATDFRRDRKAQAAVWEAPEPPGISADAMDTNSLVELLPDDLYDAVDAFWHLSGPVEVRAAAINVHVATLYRRRDAAILQLESFDQARKASAVPVAQRKPGQSTVVVRRYEFVPDAWAY